VAKDLAKAFDKIIQARGYASRSEARLRGLSRNSIN
jgi:metal-responsive CopG/Arc/MetJ family transcriptional regulator